MEAATPRAIVQEPPTPEPAAIEPAATPTTSADAANAAATAAAGPADVAASAASAAAADAADAVPQANVAPPAASPPNVRSYTCVRLPAFARRGTLLIDGRLTEPVWEMASWSEEFIDIEGPGRPRPMFRTRMKMLWDAHALYIAAELQEPDVRGSLRGRDSVIFHDNDFEVFIDPDGDGLNYGELEINALNTVWDLRLPRPYNVGGQPDDGWSLAGLRSAVWVDGTLNDARSADAGWTVELEIPWFGLQSLHDTTQPVRRAVRDGSRVRGYEVLAAESVEGEQSDNAPVAPLQIPVEGDVWRMNFSRVQWPVETDGERYQTPEGAREENWVWSPQGVVDMHRPATWGRVIFAGTPESRNGGRGPVRIIRR
ncbi:MAG: carbohydrate-binding family 9-like protein [Planctomycetota bacterium]